MRVMEPNPPDSRRIMSTTSMVDIERFVLESVEEHPRDLVTFVAEAYGLTRQGVHRHIKKLVSRGLLTATGRTRARVYELQDLVDHRFTLAVEPRLEEDRVWREAVLPLLLPLSDNSSRISQYGFTEMLNNAKNHSEGTEIVVQIKRSAIDLEMWIHDDGIGVFRKIQRDLGLDDERHAILELAKGKLTTQPERHSGEGIFFTSRAFDHFYLSSQNLALLHEADTDDWLLDSTDSGPGTFVSMEISVDSDRSLKSIFDRFTGGEEEFGFSRTVVPVRLAQYGEENLVSRSQARRLLARFDRFRAVVLDFDGVQTIGQAFADEIFRVFTREHPEINLVRVRANSEVESMILRALSRSKEIQPTS